MPRSSEWGGIKAHDSLFITIEIKCSDNKNQVIIWLFFTLQKQINWIKPVDLLVENLLYVETEAIGSAVDQ